MQGFPSMAFADIPPGLSIVAARRLKRLKRLSRRTAIVGAGLAVPLIARAAGAPEITWRVGHGLPTDFPLHVRLIEAAGEITARTGGRMRLEVYGNSELGGSAGLFAQLRAGTIDIVPMTSQALSPNLAVSALPRIGFAFNGYDRVWAALDGQVGVFLRQQIHERLGLIAMDRCWNFGFRQVTTSGRLVTTAADIAGMRLRTPPDADIVDLFQALKALPVAMSLSDMDHALNRHEVEGQEGILPLVKAAHLERYQTICALTNHIWDGYWMCVAGRSWSNLSDNFKEIVAAALNNGGLNQRKDTLDAESGNRQELEADGMKFNTVDPGSFRSVLREAGYYDRWRNKIGDDGWAALLKYTGRLS